MFRPLAIASLCNLELLFALFVLCAELLFARSRYFLVGILQAWLVESPVPCPDDAVVQSSVPIVHLVGN